MYAADWGGLPVAIKVPAESCDVFYEEARGQLEHEEEVYRRLHSRLEESVGAGRIGVACG